MFEVRRLFLIVLVIALAGATGLARSDSAHACTSGRSFADFLRGSEAIVEGVVLVTTYSSADADPRGYLPVELLFRVTRVHRGDLGDGDLLPIRAPDSYHAQLGWVPMGCGAFDRDPLLQYAVLALGRDEAGEFRVLRPGLWYLGDGPDGDHGYRRALAALTAAGVLTEGADTAAQAWTAAVLVGIGGLVGIGPCRRTVEPKGTTRASRVSVVAVVETSRDSAATDLILYPPSCDGGWAVLAAAKSPSGDRGNRHIGANRTRGRHLQSQPDS